MKQPAPGVIVAGKYVLDGQLAEGGMGSVWSANHVDLQIPLAIKFMGPEVASSEEGRTRFEREAKAAAFLQSPHVVNVQDYGVDDGLAYIAMELLVGEDLSDRLYKVGRLSLEDTLEILKQAAKALRRAQDLGIVHRDLKPENLFLAKVDDGEEVLKILDFGIAKETGPTLLASKASNTGQIIGSPQYMSPEAVRGVKDIDHRSDLWSLAVIVFQCVTGKLPFESEVVGDVMGMILADPLPKATDIAPDLPPEIDEFFDRALCRDRTKRFQSAREMAEAFADVLGAPVSGFSIPGSGQKMPPMFTPSPGEVAPVSSQIGPRSARLAPGPASSRDAFAARTAIVATPVHDRPSRTGRAAMIGIAALVAIVGLMLVLMRAPKPPVAGADPVSSAPTVASPPPVTATPAGAIPTAEPTATATPPPADTASAKRPTGNIPAPKGSGKGPKPAWGF